MAEQYTESYFYIRKRTAAFLVALSRVTKYLHQLRNNQVLCDHSASQKIPLHFFQLAELSVHNCSYFVLLSPLEMLKTCDSTVCCRLWCLKGYSYFSLPRQFTLTHHFEKHFSYCLSFSSLQNMKEILQLYALSQNCSIH